MFCLKQQRQACSTFGLNCIEFIMEMLLPYAYLLDTIFAKGLILYLYEVAAIMMTLNTVVSKEG